MSENGVIEYKGLSFDDPITSVLDSTPLIGHKIYFNSMKYHLITADCGGSVKYHTLSKGRGGSREDEFCIMR